MRRYVCAIWKNGAYVSTYNYRRGFAADFAALVSQYGPPASVEWREWKKD